VDVPVVVQAPVETLDVLGRHEVKGLFEVSRDAVTVR
jgi:hypothetical protein